VALIQCRECKQEISDQAAACPHCGAPNTPVASPPPPPPPSSQSPAPPPPPPAPSPPAGGAGPGRRSGGLLLGGLLVLALGVIGVLQISRRQRVEPPSPPPAPRFIVDNVDANETCTVLGEYCIRVRCAITNAGSAPGVVQIAAELNEDSVSIGTRHGTRSLAVGQQDTLTLDFPEANLGKQHSFRCYEAP
jgi:hypothetical protein